MGHDEPHPGHDPAHRHAGRRQHRGTEDAGEAHRPHRHPQGRGLLVPQGEDLQPVAQQGQHGPGRHDRRRDGPQLVPAGQAEAAHEPVVDDRQLLGRVCHVFQGHDGGVGQGPQDDARHDQVEVAVPPDGPGQQQGQGHRRKAPGEGKHLEGRQGAAGKQDGADGPHRRPAAHPQHVGGHQGVAEQALIDEPRQGQRRPAQGGDAAAGHPDVPEHGLPHGARRLPGQDLPQVGRGQGIPPPQTGQQKGGRQQQPRSQIGPLPHA